MPGAVFGAFLSDAPKFSEHFEGTGETFLFTLKPDYQVRPYYFTTAVYARSNVCPLARNHYRRRKFSTVCLFIKIACFVLKKKYIFLYEKQRIWISKYKEVNSTYHFPEARIPSRLTCILKILSQFESYCKVWKKFLSWKCVIFVVFN